LGIAPSTVHRILTSVHLNRLSHVDRATGEPIRRYEHDHPGSMVHVDVKKLGNIPDGGGWRYVGRRQGEKNRARTPGKPRNKHSDPLLGYAYVHTVIDDHSRVAYAEIHDDETAQTATCPELEIKHKHPPVSPADERQALTLIALSLACTAGAQSPHSPSIST
jgi:hypothetical protein